MSTYQDVFRRYEKKYLLTQAQYDALGKVLEGRMVRDRFAESTIGNIYFDTPDFKLVRRSLDKPAYKEKLRLRCYKTPGEDTEAFAEIKKKFAGVVYKRRAAMAYDEAVDYLCGRDLPPADSQIIREIDWLKQFYGELQPAMCIFYDRLALFDQYQPDLRVTFDANIRWRQDRLDLKAGAWGKQLLEPGTCLMEIKIPGTTPLWLARALSELRIFPVSFSKYGLAYQRSLTQKQKEEITCA